MEKMKFSIAGCWPACSIAPWLVLLDVQVLSDTMRYDTVLYDMI
jgi:hypothetical protein